ncbi:hypothetical protein [Alicyclobacillus fastidiosus]|nr:hypothetical protein [Alicyclobacillus fastidiosus]
MTEGIYLFSLAESQIEYESTDRFQDLVQQSNHLLGLKTDS